ncbi:MAG: hypothetical protein QXO86_08010 [Nitrososphaerota archaeon]|jgi:hypothetical protein|nr:hypothetical protein [Candidatus Caldarchaeales archaeon]
MTLVIGLKWRFEDSDAILITSDSKVTTSLGITYEMRKIYPILLDENKPVALAGVAGDASLAKQGAETAEEVLLSYARERFPIDRDGFRSAVRDIERRLVRRFSELRSYGIDTSFQMLLGSVDLEGRGSLYLLDSRGLSEPVHDNPGYAIIGSGMVTGGILLFRMIGFDPGLELGLLSAFIIDSVSEVDSSVGQFIGDSYLMRLETANGERRIVMGPLKDEVLIKYKEQIRARREIIGKIWRLCDELGEEKITGFINDLEKQKH